ncbi:MAG: hypothetical protein ILA17_02140, partial [Ruminococcus sp.]|nr:hypothetical protein [Ruminococcus sp.]
MLKVTLSDIQQIMNDYHITERAADFSELQRYDYDKGDESSKEVRLIIKVIFESRSPVVIRFKNENSVTEEMIEKQSRFAETLHSKGIVTPHNYSNSGRFAMT